MRSRSITTLLILIAFTLGLALGGQAPRQVSAQDEPEDIGWKNDGETLVLFNQTNDSGYLVTAAYTGGSGQATVPTSSYGSTEVATEDLDKVYVYKLSPVFECDPRECRRCENGPFLCPVPPRPIPVDEVERYNLLGPQ